MGNQGHPNGAIELIESVLCVPDADLSNFVRRYARYLQRPARSDGPLRIFDLSNSRVLIIPNSALDRVLPGEAPPELPAFVGYGLAVRDLGPHRTFWSGPSFRCKHPPWVATHTTSSGSWRSCDLPRCLGADDLIFITDMIDHDACRPGRCAEATPIGTGPASADGIHA